MPTLLVMAAGLGSRYGGGAAKQIDGVGPNGERLLDYAIFDARRAGFRRVVFVIREELRPMFADLAATLPPDLEAVSVVQDISQLPAWFTRPRDRKKPWGTVHAVLAARDVLHGPFAAVNADDFYGAEAYALGAEAAAAAEREGVSTIVGLRLDRTLSPHGAVSRGICRVEGGRFFRLDEVREVARGADNRVTGKVRGEACTLTGLEIASMNFWVFPASILGRFAERFEAFLHARGGDPSAECMLPEVMDELLTAGQTAIRVVETPGPWFGLTHQDDRPMVRRGLQQLVAEGVYPSPLWTVAAT